MAFIPNIQGIRITGSLTGITSIQSSTISATTYYNLPPSSGSSVSGDYLPLSGGTVTGDTIFTSGLTGTTLFLGGDITLSSATDNKIYFFDATNQGYVYLSPTDGGILFTTTVDSVEEFARLQYAGAGLVDFKIGFLNSGTSATISNGNLTSNRSISLPNDDGTLVLSVNNVVPNNAGDVTLTLPFLSLTGGTVSGNTVFQSGLTANTISATTYQNLPSQSGTGISSFSYSASTGVLTITKNDTNTLTAGTFSYLTATTLSSSNVISVISNGGSPTTTTINAVTGGSYSNGTITLSGTGTIQSAITGFTKYFTTGSTPTGVVINSGDRWYNTNNGIELVYINDGDSSQWVQPANTPGPPGYSNLMITSGITASAATLNINTNYYGVNYNGNVNLTLPNPSGYDGYNMTIKDEGGYSSTYRIRLTPLSGLIDGNTYVDMNLNYIALHLVARNNNWWLI